MRIVLKEQCLPIRPSVSAACELLGIDPLYVANEGKLVALLPEDQVDIAIDIMHGHPLGKNATVIGTVELGDPGLELATTIGSRRAVRMPQGELLPRIC
ncbi:MAG: hypothetical protein GY847_33615 [Proteobacteria bacterium]|nr:hypothetical protein [Pseudomonadota bacterium]